MFYSFYKVITDANLFHGRSTTLTITVNTSVGNFGLIISGIGNSNFASHHLAIE